MGGYAYVGVLDGRLCICCVGGNTLLFVLKRIEKRHHAAHTKKNGLSVILFGKKYFEKIKNVYYHPNNIYKKLNFIKFSQLYLS